MKYQYIEKKIMVLWCTIWFSHTHTHTHTRAHTRTHTHTHTHIYLSLFINTETNMTSAQGYQQTMMPKPPELRSKLQL